MEHFSSDCLKYERKRLGYTLLELANAIEVSDMTIKRWEKNTPIPSDKLALLAKLGFDVMYILTGRAIPALAADEQMMLESYRGMDAAMRKRILAMMLSDSMTSEAAGPTYNTSIQNQRGQVIQGSKTVKIKTAR